MIFRGRISFLLTVDRAARGGKDHSLYLQAFTSLQQVDEPQDIDPSVEQGIGYGAPQLHLSRMKAQDVRRYLREEIRKRRIKDIHGVKGGLPIQILLAPAREIVNDNNLMTLCDVGVDDMRSDKTCPTGDDYLHINQPRSPSLKY
jgi:hypothetical protein